MIILRNIIGFTMNIRNLFFVLLISGALMGFLSKIFGQTEKAPEIFYSVVYKAYNVHVNLSVNGNTVIDEEYEFSGAGSRPINSWLQPGKNTLTLKVKVVNAEKEYHSINLLITKAMEGQYSDEGEQLWLVKFDETDSAKTLPYEISKIIEM